MKDFSPCQNSLIPAISSLLPVQTKINLVGLYTETMGHPICIIKVGYNIGDIENFFSRESCIK